MVELSMSDEEMVEHVLTVESSTVELSLTDEVSVIEESSSTVEFSIVKVLLDGQLDELEDEPVVLV